MLETSIQGLVVHGTAHLSGETAAVWDIVPDADRIIVVVEAIGNCIQVDFGLLSSLSVYVLQPRVQIAPAPGGQPEC